MATFRKNPSRPSREGGGPTNKSSSSFGSVSRLFKVLKGNGVYWGHVSNSGPVKKTKK